MKELIDRKTLIEALRKDIQEYKDTDGQSIPFKTGMIYRQIEVIKIIEEQPTVEAVPVVRCKDCKYFCDGYPNVLNADGLCENTDCLVDLYCFCSYGERKENE